MAKKRRPERRISIRSIRRDPPDYQKLGRAFLAAAMLQAEAEAEAEALARQTTGEEVDDAAAPDILEDAS
jgi:hypothetical protein